MLWKPNTRLSKRLAVVILWHEKENFCNYRYSYFWFGGNTLTQGDDLDSARWFVIASRTTSKAESRYPQLYLEATAIDFVLHRFRNYLVGAPQVLIITDHKLLFPISNSHWQGLIWTDRIELCHQDINYTVQYQYGKANQSKYLSQHGKPLSSLPEEE